MKKTIIIADDAPQPIGPYSQAIKFNDLVFVSGQVGIDPNTGELVDGGVKEQGRQIMENIKAVLEAADSSFEKIIKFTVYLRSIDFFSTLNDVFVEYLKGDRPTRETVEVCRLPKDADIEISCIAHI